MTWARSPAAGMPLSITWAGTCAWALVEAGDTLRQLHRQCAQLFGGQMVEASRSGMNAGRVSTAWLRAVRSHLWTTLLLMPWLSATLATEVPGWPTPARFEP